jgi:N-carbamoyl-L-amino-acid hydrolase
MAVLAEVILAGQEAAERHEALVTIGRVEATPNAANSIAERVSAWLDVRAPQDQTLDCVIKDVRTRVERAAIAMRVDAEVICESRMPGVRFSSRLLASIATLLDASDLPAVRMDTGAGHDAAVLAAHVPAAMLFVRNPTGISHAMSEAADTDDCIAGVAVLALILEHLARELPNGQSSSP